MAKAAGEEKKTKPGRPVPLSEDQRKFHEHWTKEDCIAHLREIAEQNPTQVITRNFFRVNSDISESTWNRYFGTFHEFKRQAGIVLSRHAHRLEKNIARHASVDIQRKMMTDKTDWEGKYLNPNPGRWKTQINLFDIHDIECDPFYRRVVIDVTKRLQPDRIVIGGDIFDLPEFSKYTQDPRTFGPLNRIRWVHKFLEDLRAAAQNAEIFIIEGNHEFRLVRHLTEQTPALLPILSELMGLTIPDLLGLKKYEVNYIARMDLSAWSERDIKKEMRKNYLISWECYLVHHFPEGREMGFPGSNGHHHKHVTWSAYSPIFGPFEWHQSGCGHVRSASYCAGEKWGNGFIIAHIDTHTKSVQQEYADVRDFCCVGGKYYFRSNDEAVFKAVA